MRVRLHDRKPLHIRRNVTFLDDDKCHIVLDCGLPAEVLIDLAIELLDIASRKLSPPPITRTAVGLGAARWRNASPEERRELLRKAVQARWAKHRRGGNEIHCR